MKQLLAAATGLAAALFARPADAASCIPGFDYAVFAEGSIQVQGRAGTDSYDSSLGPYATTKACSDAALGTNSTNSGGVQIQAASTTVCGDVDVGAGGDPSTVIQQTGGATITGDKEALDANIALPGVSNWPTLPNTSGPMSPDFQNAAATLSPGYTYEDVKCKNGSLTLSAGQYVIKSLVLDANCELRVGSGPIEVYFTDKLSLQGGTVVNATMIPSNMMFFGAKRNEQSTDARLVQVQGGANAAFVVYAPMADCQIQGNAEVYGAMVCMTLQLQGNAQVHYDRALRNLEAGGFECPDLEISRATPIVTTIGTDTAIVQGTYEYPFGTQRQINAVADVASFTFPYIQGHMRARTVASTTTAQSAFSSGTVLFDAGETGKIPTASNGGCSTFNGSCRNLFTVTQTPDADGTSSFPPRVQFKDSNASTIGALIAPASAVAGIGATEWQTIVRKVLAAPLGGVDRSTVAVIPASPIAGVATRPTIAYFGATDGMLHAVCASIGGTTPSQTTICPSLGTELWAFMPRTQLPLVRKNTTRIDGSVHVVDAFGDFNNPPTGIKSFRTILVFQTGYADTSLGAAAAVYALDVTDPANPVVLWEYTTPTTASAYALGTGLSVSAGSTLVSGKPTNLAFVQTTNGGSGGTGMVTTAINLETGAPAWQFGYAYPTPPRGVAGDLPLPKGLPGGAVGVDLTKQGFITDVVAGDLYGNLWRLDAATGASKTGATTPLFSFSTNKHPIGARPAVYSDGVKQFAVFGSGGYADPLQTTWASGTQSLIAIDIALTSNTYPVNETSTALKLKQDLASGANVYSQVLVVGEELFVTTDSTDVNATAYGSTGANTGSLVRVNSSTNATTTVVVRGGAGSVGHSGAQLYSASSDMQQRVGTDAAGTTGTTVDTAQAAKVVRLLWLRAQ